MNSSVPLSPPLIAAALIRIAATSTTKVQNSVVLNACLVSVARRRAVLPKPPVTPVRAGGVVTSCEAMCDSFRWIASMLGFRTRPEADRASSLADTVPNGARGTLVRPERDTSPGLFQAKRFSHGANSPLPPPPPEACFGGAGAGAAAGANSVAGSGGGGGAGGGGLAGAAGVGAAGAGAGVGGGAAAAGAGA